MVVARPMAEAMTVMAMAAMTMAAATAKGTEARAVALPVTKRGASTMVGRRQKMRSVMSRISQRI